MHPSKDLCVFKIEPSFTGQPGGIGIAPIIIDHQRSPAQALRSASIAISHYSASPQRLATAETQSEQCLSQQAQPPRRDEHSAATQKMFGPRRGYDAIGEAPVSNADKPRVQPVKVDPKVIERRPVA